MCKKGSYCSSECENKRSIPHIFTCSKRAITTADYLYMDILHDELPKDPDVMKDFCFDQFSFTDQSKLLGLYKGLLLSDIAVEDIHTWRVEGSLVANIKRFYYQIPEVSRGGYFPWFLDHINIFDQR